MATLLTVNSCDARLRFANNFTICRRSGLRLGGPKLGRTGDMFPLDILFRQVPEGMEFLAVLFVILGSLGIMVLFGAWWSR